MYRMAAAAVWCLSSYPSFLRPSAEMSHIGSWAPAAGAYSGSLLAYVLVLVLLDRKVQQGATAPR